MGYSLPAIPHRSELDWGPWFKQGYNRCRLSVMSYTATPMIIIGLVMTILGTLGLITALTGASIPGIEFIAKHIPASVVLSLFMMRAGLHLLNNGPMQALKLARWRQEAVLFYMQAWMEQDLEKKAALLKEISALNYSLPEEYRLEEQLGVNALYGKTCPDHWISSKLKPEIAKSGMQKWYDFWLNKQGTIGKIDSILGNVMLVAGVASIVFLFIGSDNLPSELGALGNDPHLSIAFALLLISYWLDCTKRGQRMQGLQAREIRRADYERDYQLIAMGICRNQQVEHPSFQNRIQHEKEPQIKLTKLAIPLITLGGLLTLAGLFYFGASISGSMPQALCFLTSNDSLSVLFATTLITAGFFFLYQGISLKDKKQKKMWKQASLQLRTALIDKVYDSGTKGVIRDIIAVEKPVDSGRIRALKWMAIPGFALGGFLFLSGLIGVFAAGGMPIDSALNFITEDPQFSAFFCVSMMLFGGDAISNADRMRSYQARKEEDYTLLKALEQQHDRIMPQYGPLAPPAHP